MIADPNLSIGYPDRSLAGSVATPGGSLVKVAFVPTALSHRRPIHEPQAVQFLAPSGNLFKGDPWLIHGLPTMDAVYPRG